MICKYTNKEHSKIEIKLSLIYSSNFNNQIKIENIFKIMNTIYC